MRPVRLDLLPPRNAESPIATALLPIRRCDDHGSQSRRPLDSLMLHRTDLSPLTAGSHESKSMVAYRVVLACGALLACLVGFGHRFAPAALAADPAPAATLPSDPAAFAKGRDLYHVHCAACHGDSGEGTADSGGEPLTGDHPLPELARIISDTMPEDAPEKVVGGDAEAVAAYIHEAFYSPAAQIRTAPPKRELTRLTINQYRNSVADIIAGFRGRGEWQEAGGLDAKYYNGKDFRSNKLRLERKDPGIDFDFGDGSPVPDQISDKEFSIRWRGGLFAPETGIYEFVVRSDCGFKFAVNSPETPTIDRWVKSGDASEFRASAFLLGGRRYPIDLQFFKYGQKSARISLFWKPPQGVEELVPAPYLASGSYPQVLAVETKFPPDDASAGYERGTSISREWDEAATRAAIEVADKVAADLNRLAGLEAEQGGSREDRLRRFAETFAKRAFRRPLSETEKAFFVDACIAGAADEQAAVRRLVLLTLKSPRFLYPGLRTNTRDAFDTMSALALTLWDSIPDDAMLEAAAEGAPSSPQATAEWAARMLDDPRARAKTREFFRWWLMLDHFQELPKDDAQFAAFDERVVAELKRSLWLSLDELVWSGSADFRQLMTAHEWYVNGRLAQIYGFDLPAEADFEKRAVAPEQSAGVLSHPLLMAGLAYHDGTSPIHRGVFLTRNVIGRALRPPPEDFTPLAADLHAGLTTRERVALQTAPAECQRCHAIINPLGFALESFDAIGRVRETEADKPIDATGWYRTLDGQQISFDGVRPLGEFLASHEEVHETFVRRVFEHFAKQPIAASGEESLSRLQTRFTDSDYNIRDLIVAAAVTAATAR